MSAVAPIGGQTFKVLATDELTGTGKELLTAANAEASGTGDKKLTVKEFKKLMNQYFTVRRSIVKACGHKIDEHSPDGPKNNCEECWFAFFNNNGEVVQTVVEISQKHGPEAVVNMRGIKFLKMFRRFMSTLAAWKAKSLESDTHPTD